MSSPTQYHQLLIEQSLRTPAIFWDIKPGTIVKLSTNALLERLLGFGDIEQFRAIIKDRENFVPAFDELKNKSRTNLDPKTINFVEVVLGNKSN